MWRYGSALRPVRLASRTDIAVDACLRFDCLDQVFDPELEEEVSYSKVLEQQRSNDQSEAALHEIELGAIDSVGTWCA